MSGKWKIAATGLITVGAGLLIGWAAPSPPAPIMTQATITVKAGTADTCEQKVNGQLQAFPPLSKGNKDTIEWPTGTAALAPHVTFPNGQSPFFKKTFVNGENSRPPTTNVVKDYPFKSVTVFPAHGHPVNCSDASVQGMGVHIDH